MHINWVRDKNKGFMQIVHKHMEELLTLELICIIISMSYCEIVYIYEDGFLFDEIDNSYVAQ